MEGVLGIITEVTFRVQLRPARRAKATVFFLPPRILATEAETQTPMQMQTPMSAPTPMPLLMSFHHGARVVQSIVQSGLLPANLRLIDGAEADMSRRAGWTSLPGNFLVDLLPAQPAAALCY